MIKVSYNFWLLIFYKVMHIDSDSGTLLGNIDLSEYGRSITSVTFGGKDLEILYVTSGGIALPGYGEPGSLFAIHDLGVTGARAGVPFVQKF